jgi:hypothetical protein
MRQALTLAAAAILAGCRSPPSSPAMDAPPAVEQPPALGPLSGDAIVPLREGTWRYEDGEAEVQHRCEPTTQYDAQWAIDEPRRTRYLARDEQGNVVLIAVADRDEAALTLFRPPLLVAPATLSVGESRSAQAAMRVVDLRQPRRQKEAGTATRTVRYLQDRLVKTPAGSFHAAHLEVAFEADLRLADAQETTTLMIVPDIGPVVIDRRETVTVLGILPRHTEQTLRLLEHVAR